MSIPFGPLGPLLLPELLFLLLPHAPRTAMDPTSRQLINALPRTLMLLLSMSTKPLGWISPPSSLFLARDNDKRSGATTPRSLTKRQPGAGGCERHYAPVNLR